MPEYMNGLILYALIVFCAYQTLLLVDFVGQMFFSEDDDDMREDIS